MYIKTTKELKEEKEKEKKERDNSEPNIITKHILKVSWLFREDELNR